MYAKKAPHPDRAIFELGVPVLGICYGVQLMGHFLDGDVEHSKAREYGHGVLTIQKPGRLFADLPKKLRVWNSHGDKLTKLPPGVRAIRQTVPRARGSVNHRHAPVRTQGFAPLSRPLPADGENEPGMLASARRSSSPSAPPSPQSSPRRG